MKTRSKLYRIARLMGDVSAAGNGYKKGGVSGAVKGEAKRQVRKKVYSKSNGLIQKALRKGGLW